MAAAAAAVERYSNRNSTAVNLLITSADCDPKAELTFSVQPPLNWNAIVDALNRAKYNFAMRRLPPPPDISTTRNPKIRNSRTRFAILSLQASKKVAFFYGDDSVNANYQITYDESLMNDLPSFRDLKGLPRFHLFTSLPEDLQSTIAERLDGVGFARMRCVSRQLSRLNWKPSFNILKYSHPVVNKQRTVQLEKLNNNIKCGGGGGGGGYCFLGNGLVRFASAVCFVVVVCWIANEVQPGVGVYEDEDEDEYDE